MVYVMDNGGQQGWLMAIKGSTGYQRWLATDLPWIQNSYGHWPIEFDDLEWSTIQQDDFP